MNANETILHKRLKDINIKIECHLKTFSNEQKKKKVIRILMIMKLPITLYLLLITIGLLLKNSISLIYAFI